MKIQYVADDGSAFDAAKDRARHELENTSGLMDKINLATSKLPHAIVARWCGPNFSDADYAFACACSGCVNSIFSDLELNNMHWQVWFAEFREPQDNDFAEVFDDVRVILKDSGTNRLAVWKLMRESIFMRMQEAKDLLDTPNAVLIQSIEYYKVAHLVDAFADIGAVLEIKRNKN